MKEQLLEMLAVISDDEVVSASARAMAAMVAALEKEGFSRAEAMALIVAHGMGVKTS